jgi:hypothetical protein
MSQLLADAFAFNKATIFLTTTAISMEYTAENTTWFNTAKHAHSVARITDYKGGLVIGKCGYDYPVWIYDVSRADIGFNRKKAEQLVRSQL